MTAACAQIKFPLPSLNAAFMPSAVLQLIFPVAGIAFLVLVLTDVPELNGFFRCWPARSRCRYPNVGFVPLPLPRAHRGFCPCLKDCDAGTLDWRQQIWVPFLLPLLCCLSFEPCWTLDFCFLFFWSCSLRWQIIGGWYCAGWLYKLLAAWSIGRCTRSSELTGFYTAGVGGVSAVTLLIPSPRQYWLKSNFERLSLTLHIC